MDVDTWMYLYVGKYKVRIPSLKNTFFPNGYKFVKRIWARTWKPYAEGNGSKNHPTAAR